MRGRPHLAGGFDGARRADVEGGVDTGCAGQRAAGRQPEHERTEAGNSGEALKPEPIDTRSGLRLRCHGWCLVPQRGADARGTFVR